MNFLLASVLKSSFLLLGALGATHLLKGKSAALRHCILAAALVGAALAPALGWLLPSWKVIPQRDIPRFWIAASDGNAELEPDTPGVQALAVSAWDSRTEATAPAPRPAPAPAMQFAAAPGSVVSRTAPHPFDWMKTIEAIWLFVALVACGQLIAGVLRLAWIAADSDVVREGKWIRAGSVIARAYELRQPPRLLVSGYPSILATWGILQADVLLPAGAEEWPEDRVHVVLSHELAHVRRGDWLMHTLAEAIRAIYWFNPLVWIVCAQLRQESEQACDDAVLHRGVTGSDYASHLLELARTLNGGPGVSAAAPMAAVSTLDRRFRAMLNPSVNRDRVTRWAATATVATILTVTVSLAVLRATAEKAMLLPRPVPIPEMSPEIRQKPSVLESLSAAAVSAVAELLPQQPAAAPVQNPSDPNARARIEGIVVDAATNKPLLDASVGLLVNGLVQIRPDRVPVDKSGHFVFEIPGGSQTIGAAKDGYNSGAGLFLTLAPGQHLDNVVLPMSRVAIAAGRLFDSHGQPAVNVDVIAFMYQYNGGGIRYRNDVISRGQVQTNDLGEFRMNIPAGEYFLEFRPAAAETGDAGMLLGSMYYPGTTNLSKAEALHVESGADVRIGNISLIAVRGGNVRLHISNVPGGTPRIGPRVAVFPRDRPGTLLRTVMGAGDVVDLGRLVPGAYDVRVDLTTDISANFGQAQIEVGESDLQIDVALKQLTYENLAGRAVVETNNGGAPRPVAGVRLGMYDALTGRPTPTQTLTSQADGSFTPLRHAPNPPSNGFYRVGIVDAPPGMYVAAVTDGERDLLKDGYQFIPGYTANIVVTLRDSAGIAKGAVTDSNGKKISNAVVALIPDDADPIHSIAARPTDQDGVFSFQVPPGNYHIYAWQRLSGARYFEKDFMNAYTEKGVAVQIRPGGTVVADLKALEQ